MRSNPSKSKRASGNPIQFETAEPRILFAIQASLNFQSHLLSINGDGADNTIVVSRDIGGNIFINGGAVPVFAGPATIANTARIDITGFTGNDTLSADETNGPLPRVDLQGREGNDTLTGNSVQSVINGDDGDDVINGRGGDDAINPGAGNDTIIWNANDGADLIQDQGGTDTLQFNGSSGGENVDMFNDDGFFSITRNNSAAAVLATNIETVNIGAAAGADNITIHDLTGTGVKTVNVDLANTVGGTSPDAFFDHVFVDGTFGNDTLSVQNNGNVDTVIGAAALVNVSQPNNVVDTLTVNGLPGDDLISATVGAKRSQVILLGDLGNDSLLGSASNDVIDGGDGDDTIEGLPGNDLIMMGTGNDKLTWFLTDGSDTVEGQSGSDRIVMNGSATGADTMTVGSNGTRALLNHQQKGFTISSGGVETIDVKPGGGADTIILNDQTGTGVLSANVLLDTEAGVADGAIDTIIANATSGGDSITIADVAGETRVQGLAAAISVVHPEAIDVLNLNALDGLDFLTVNLSNTAQQAMRNVFVSGGADHGTLDVKSTPVDGAVTVVPSTGDLSVSVNLDLIGIANVRFEESQRLSSLLVQTGGTATLTPGGNKVLTTEGFGVFNTGKIDLTDNSMIVDYFSPSPLSTIQSRVNAARAGGSFAGNGLTSSAAKQNAAHNTTLGVMEASEFKSIFGPSAKFDGQTIDATAVLVKYTYYGDTDFNGQVNFDDYSRVDSGFNLHKTGWLNGDFDGNGQVDFDDYSLIDLAFNTQGAIVLKQGGGRILRR